MADLERQLASLEAAIRVDPARRGLLGQGAMLGLGQLAAAARQLAEHGRDIALVTGFAIPTPSGPVAETDGPPGAALLADVCHQLDMRVHLVTDSVCQQAVAVAARLVGLDQAVVESCPLATADAADWCAGFHDRHPGLTHLIAVERSGPSHTTSSLEAAAGVALLDNYVAHVPSEAHDRPHNMRGEPIDAHTAPLHLLFESAKVGTCERVNVKPTRTSATESSHSLATIGIGDGGNEIGMGLFPWGELHPLIAGEQGRRIACRIATDWTIVAGTSNWGAFALAAALAVLRGRPDLLDPWTSERHLELLEALVRYGPAVDGVTREQTATVDGLPFLTYIQPWERIRAIGGLCST